ncbi:8-oxo-dGTP diphosphatase [Thermanaeromonas toyohensis ToBE]|uniref:8-oxo-dGTP diphosphatase n=1 Tax=Thermanaeromonas toyohensis ToBE TaxID=698762 RepID=A0A1W1VZW7_9FIRM|nr:8-oxo-dGTP diphosphatase MutT [Thermanaeromonas toyohensis]SMB98813.1 8-oxo-dGTP diphosphatase [Thermanaeromonas toyohensis ToBE]
MDNKRSSSRVKVAAAVIKKNGKVLVCRRPAGDKLAFKWEFPGGKIEKGETPESCLEREVLEELGIKIRVGDLICTSAYDYEHISIELLAFLADWVSGTIIPYVHDEIRWVNLAELNLLEFVPADLPIVEKLMKEKRV